MAGGEGFRVSPPRVFTDVGRAARPPAGSGSVDAHRQTSFTLGDEADLIVEGLRFEATAAQASSGGKFRNQRLAGSMVLWSRSWLCRLQALHAVEWGDYVAAMPLIRAATDLSAAMAYLLDQSASEWEEWLQEGGIAQSVEHRATEFVLHPFRAAEILAADEVLGPIYRASSDLTMAHFGSSALLAAADSAPGKVAPTFGDRDFHLALAEITFGWLEALGARTVGTLGDHPGVFAREEAGMGEALRERLIGAAARPERARVELLETSEGVRYLVTGWRRGAGAKPGRVLL